MASALGIRREDKNPLERRAPLTPDHVQRLVHKRGVQVIVQPSDRRVFRDADYERAGATISEDLSPCGVILGVKEIRPDLLLPGKVYGFFSHTIKGQAHNMPMLRRLLDLGCSLVDYEKIVDAGGRRLVAFGRFAGLAGMIDTLWCLGRRLQWEGTPNPFAEIEHAYHYPDLATAMDTVLEVADRIRDDGLPDELVPFVVGVAGSGNVGRGALEILDLLPTRRVTPSELPHLAGDPAARNVVHTVVIDGGDLVVPADPGKTFDFADYLAHPEGYRSRFEQYLPHLNVLLVGIYWDERYPRLVTKEYIERTWSGPQPPRLRVIADVSADIRGSVEITLRTTGPDNPVYVYEPATGQTIDGWKGRGPVIVAVDMLPTELPVEASMAFGEALRPLITPLVRADYSADFEELDLPAEVKGSLVCYRGKLTPDYRYLEKHLAGVAAG